jgi:UDP-N-acetylglucosamine 1-carboxyvinyltransferase
MDKFLVQGRVCLEGEVATSGAKNSALPVLAACLLTAEPVVLHRIPRVRDVGTMMRLLKHNGAAITEREDGAIVVHAAEVTKPEAPYDLVKTMRASSLVLGPLVARVGRARVSLPGGCAIGARPIGMHVSGLEELGARMEQSHGYIEATVPDRLRGCIYTFDRITVTGTEDLLMAAVLAEGETVLQNAAREPEVVDVANLLTKMGAQIEGAGTSTIRVRGVAKLHRAEHAIIPDRIEAGTFAVAAAITGGDVRINECEPEHLQALIAKMRQAGVDIREDGKTLHVKAGRKLSSVDVETQEHPGFATDLQAQFMTLMTQAEGISIITERIFENRFMHVLELARMGANIRVEGQRAIVAGPRTLSGAEVIASDLRASASLVIAAQVATGETIIDRVYHIDRGYEKIVEKLRGLGARMERIETK